ncbi:MAG: hypothetical protein A3D31_17590 [Candidatus Fluviicola riflensis]|nr:MAG: hypothetical protein CHH17_02530 [Candidatus Fluviicola riflensis]OGS76798.1 MAG: hypothetical protein A3D31_17590 [Candidatus Fluviicola riflensis]OGS82847.1 MAG: hypothetical protein A2724_13770 [Fluviicola sp. RIFCSPHIGHO2_01_FULL_43_53]OGS88528.1 MAG: hypothetical protein A3E30_07095 [Fluviicola sp. RIFCSPHIGHO2_12_FULL_43_24]
MFKNPSLVIAIAQFVVFVPILCNFLLRVQEKSRLRFFILATFYFVFNLLNLFLSKFYSVEHWLTKVITHLSGFFIAISLLLYIIKEFKIFEIILNFKNVFWVGITVISVGFLTSVFLIGTSEIARFTLIVIPIISTILMSVYIHIQYKKTIVTKHLNSIFLFSGYFALILMTSLPLLFYFKIVNEFVFSVINMTFILLSVGYFFQLLMVSNNQHEALKNIDLNNRPKTKLEDFDFTPREIETAILLLKGKSFDQIADECFISAGTVYKHASNLYKKTGCKDHKEFRRKFRNTI